MALLHFYIPCALIMAFQFAQKIRGVIGRKIEIDIFKQMEEIEMFSWVDNTPIAEEISI